MNEELDKGIKETNDKLKDIKKQIEGYQSQIEKLKEQTITVSNGFLDGLTSNSKRYNELFDMAKDCTGQNSSRELYASLRNLYNIAFHGIVSGRVQTNIEIPDKIKRYDWNKELWINSRGLAFKPTDSYYSWRAKDRSATVCVDFSAAMDIIIKYPRIEDFIPKEEKKEIFRAFRKCLIDWKQEMEHKPLDIKGQNISVLHVEDSYHTGVNNVSVLEGNNIQVTLYGDMFSISIYDKNNWRSLDSFYIQEKLPPRERHIIQQFSDEVYDSIKKYILKYKDAHEHNRKLYNVLREEISPYIMHRMV